MFHRAYAFTNYVRMKLRLRQPQRHPFIILLAMTLTVAATLPAAPTDKTDVMTMVRKSVDSFNKGDVKAFAAACADQASVIDEFPPYEWHGADACVKWAEDYDADAKKNGITDGVVILGTPLHVDVIGDRAYFGILADYKFKKNGKLVQEIGSRLTIALQKSEGGWRMTGWAWAKH